MDRQSPHAPSLILAVVATAIWALVVAVTPTAATTLGLGLASLVVIVVALAAPIQLWPRPFPWAPIMVGALVGLVSLWLTHALAPPVLDLVPSWRAELWTLQQEAILLSPLAAPLVVALTLSSVIGEELIWRGLAISALRARTSDIVAVIAAAALYAVGQIGFGLSLPPVAALALGLVWGALRVGTRSLAASLVAHTIWTTGVLWVWPLASAA